MKIFGMRNEATPWFCFELFFWGWEMKQPLIPFWTVLGMRIEATPEFARTVIRPVAVATRIPDASGVKQPLNSSRHPSMGEASSKAGRTVATDSS